MKICPEWSRINTHRNTDALPKQQISYLKIGFFDKMFDKKFDLLFGEAVVSVFLLGPKSRKFVDSKIFSIAVFFHISPAKGKIDNPIQILNEVIMLQLGIQRAEIIGRNVLGILLLIDPRKLFNDRS